MKKVFNVTKISNKLADENVFFRDNKTDIKDTQFMQKEAKAKPNDASTLSSYHASKHAIMLARPKKIASNPQKKEKNIASTEVDQGGNFIQTIRKTVREIGKESLFLRLTPEEKDQLRDIVYSFSKQRPKISENEIGRIALNYLLEDFKANGKNSILAKMIEALNA